MSRLYIKTAISVLSEGNHYLTSGFGPRTVNGKEGYHNGCDFVGGNDKTAMTDYITAFESGIVTYAVNNVKGDTPSEGNAVVIDHGCGVKTYYFHMKHGSVKVKKGDLISRGNILGYMGNTGNSTGAHLHFGLKLNGKWTDPLPYLVGEADLGYRRSTHELRSLKRGFKGADVALLQKLLNIELGDTLKIDGSYGALTEAAVKEYQRSKELTVDGVFGKNSWSSILSTPKIN